MIMASATASVLSSVSTAVSTAAHPLLLNRHPHHHIARHYSRRQGRCLARINSQYPMRHRSFSSSYPPPPPPPPSQQSQPLQHQQQPDHQQHPHPQQDPNHPNLNHHHHQYHVLGASLRFKNLLIVIKQTAFEEYSQLKLRGLAPKALRWKRLEQRYTKHKNCVNDLLQYLSTLSQTEPQLLFSCVNRAELDRQHLARVDLVIAVGGDGTVLSAAHFLDHGTIPLLGINSDPHESQEELKVQKKSTDERRSHGALCMCTSLNMTDRLGPVLYGMGNLATRTRIRCQVKSTFSETLLVPSLNDILIANPSPAAVSRFRMGFLHPVPEASAAAAAAATTTTAASASPPPQSQSAPVSSAQSSLSSSLSTSAGAAAAAAALMMGTGGGGGTVTRLGGTSYTVTNSLNVWSSGIWISTGTGATAAMAAAGGQPMDVDSEELQYLIREHMIEQKALEAGVTTAINNGSIANHEKLHIRWNSQMGRIFIDGSHMMHNLVLGDEIVIDNQAPPLKIFSRRNEDHHEDSTDML